MTSSILDQLFLTVAEFAKLYRTDVRSVRRGIASGQIPAVQVGRIHRIPVPKVRELLGLPPAVPEPAGTDSGRAETQETDVRRPDEISNVARGSARVEINRRHLSGQRANQIRPANTSPGS